MKGRGSNKRRDLTILGKDGSPVLTGEVKLPFQPEGSSPLRATVVLDARKKAERAKVDFFFTWNVNRCALWPTKLAKGEPHNAAYREWTITDIHREPQLELQANQETIQRWVPLFLREFAEIIRGDKPIDRKPPDLRFIDTIEAELEQPILQTTDALVELIKKQRPRNELQRWMREDQGWTLAADDDKQGVLADLNRAAQFANYALLNKVVFHEALLKRYGSELQRLDVPEHIDTGERLRLHFEGHFAKARRVTGDYETVFGEDPTSMGNRIPFVADPCVAYWRMLVEQVHTFDFSKLDYEIIGSIFERLISPEERHKFGQYYTRAEVVDLINSFCIRTGREKVMDPACGGGTFLVRAYARKRELAADQTHAERLKDLFGIDISHFATHLTTINLATRDLIDDENYPQVARSDFFDIDPGSVLLNVPKRIVTGGLGTGQTRDVEVPMLDAVVGNPPYVRQEDIPKTPKKNKNPKPGTKEFYKLVSERGYGTDLSGRSDLHVYFWLHATEFLHHGGRMGLLTSSQWLDVEYGFRLQEFILRHFEIEAVFESMDEPWFVGARVATVATLLRRQPNEAARMNHAVRFVQLRRPIAEVLEHDGSGAGAMQSADRFRDHILSLNEDTLTDRYRLRVVNQSELWNQGVKLGQLLGKSKRGPSDKPDVQQGDYYGGKWGMHLRAPDIWSELIGTYGDKFSPLGEIADIKRGITSGKDAFFFPVDASEDVLGTTPDPDEFQAQYGATRKEVKSGKVKIVKCGEGRGELMPIEAKYLEPEIHSLMNIDKFQVTKDDSNYLVFLSGTTTGKLAKYAREYVEWAESEGWHESPTCAGRVTKTTEWHDLTGARRADIILPKIAQYRIMMFLNLDRLYQASALLGLYEIAKAEREVIAGVLNSTVSLLAFILYARGLGNEANLQLDVYLASMMQIPDPRSASAGDRKRVRDAFKAMKNRDVLSFVSDRRRARLKHEQKGTTDELHKFDDRTELDMPDRRKLDDAVLRMIGVEDKDERERLIEKLYGHLRQHFEWTRQKEEKATQNKKRAKKRGPAGPSSIAAEIVEQVKREFPELMRSWHHYFLNEDVAFDTYELPADGEPELLNDLIHANTVRFVSGKRKVDVEARTLEQAELLATLATAQVRGIVRVPLDSDGAKELNRKFSKWWNDRQGHLQSLVSQRTSDEELQERTLAALLPLIPAA